MKLILNIKLVFLSFFFLFSSFLFLVKAWHSIIQENRPILQDGGWGSPLRVKEIKQQAQAQIPRRDKADLATHQT